MNAKQFQNKSDLSIFISYFKPHRKLFFLDMFCALLISMIDLAFPYVSRWCMIDKIPVKQETIELCELFRLNPYYLMSGEESVLIVCSKGSYLIQKLKEKGINASCIGFLTGNNDKVLRFGDHLRYLDRPREDEFLRYRKEKGKGNERVNFKGH